VWFERAKPYLKRLRQSQAAQTTNLGTLERLELCVCESVRIELSYEGSAHEYDADEGQWLVVNDRLFLRGYSEDSGDLLADALGAAIATLFHMADGDAFAKLLRCEPGSRPRLLKRMCGDEFEIEIDPVQLRAGQRHAYAGPIEEPIKKDPSNSPAGELPNTVPEKTHPEVTSGPELRPGIQQIEHQRARPRVDRNLVVRITEATQGDNGVQRQAIDGTLCEKRTMEFEAISARFPLQVGHITGDEAPGCDVLSFETEADRAAFKNPESRDWSKVVRFIEVKGRSSATAKIELKDNQYTAARNYGHRYYLYRFYEEQTGVYLVSVLRDPLSHREAITTAYHIDLERANATERFKFVPSS
jgi:hypothetical protein